VNLVERNSHPVLLEKGHMYNCNPTTMQRSIHAASQLTAVAGCCCGCGCSCRPLCLRNIHDWLSFSFSTPHLPQSWCCYLL